MNQVARFSNGFRARPYNKTILVTHGWHARGVCKTGRPWALHGFSRIGFDGAKKQMATHIKTFVPAGHSVEFAEVVEVTRVPSHALKADAKGRTAADAAFTGRMPRG